MYTSPARKPIPIFLPLLQDFWLTFIDIVWFSLPHKTIEYVENVLLVNVRSLNEYYDIDLNFLQHYKHYHANYHNDVQWMWKYNSNISFFILSPVMLKQINVLWVRVHVQSTTVWVALRSILTHTLIWYIYIDSIYL